MGQQGYWALADVQLLILRRRRGSYQSAKEGEHRHRRNHPHTNHPPVLVEEQHELGAASCLPREAAAAAGGSKRMRQSWRMAVSEEWEPLGLKYRRTSAGRAVKSVSQKLSKGSSTADWAVR